MYKIWHKEDWHFKRNSDNTKRYLSFPKFESAVEQAMIDGLAGAEIYQLVGTPRVVIDKITSE